MWRRFWIFGSSMKICAHFSKKRPWGVASAFKVLSSVSSPFCWTAGRLGGWAWGRPVYYTTTLWHVVTPRRACGGNIWSAVELRWGSLRFHFDPSSRFTNFISHSFCLGCVHCQHHQQPSTLSPQRPFQPVTSACPRAAQGSQSSQGVWSVVA